MVREIVGGFLVATDPIRLSLYREIGRRVVGFVGELGIKAYGAAAAVSVALSDAETVGGKCDDALAAVPNLMERYRDAKYVVDHREEIEAAVDYVHQHAPDREQLDEAAERSSETLLDIETTYGEVIEAREALADISVSNVVEKVPEAFGHVRRAWEAKPDLDSIGHLADMAEQVSPFVRQVEVLIPALYGGLLTVMDNFASDEIAATLGVMAASFVLAFALGTGVGFWARRGRPGLIARTLQRGGAILYRGWYIRNLEHALSRPLYAAARERIQSDIVADPQKTLDPEALKQLELYFERRFRGESDRLVGVCLSSAFTHVAGGAHS